MNEKDWDKVAVNYHNEIVSPFYGNTINPLLPILKKIKNKNKKQIAEFGCGYFYLAKELSKFESVHASDFSDSMIKKAKNKAKKYQNIDVVKEDIRKITYHNKFDYIISVNSIIMPSHKEIITCFANIHKSLKKNGALFMILPSMEAVLYHGMLLLHSELIGQSETQARKKAIKKFDKKSYDLFLGHYREEGETQKFYYEHEINYFLKKTGFTQILIDKVKYPWEDSDYESFPDEDPIWDWFVMAKKIS